MAQTTKRASTEENLIAVDEPVRSQEDPATNSSFNTQNSTVYCRTDIFSPQSWFEVLRERPVEELSEANRRASVPDSAAQTAAE